MTEISKQRRYQSNLQRKAKAYDRMEAALRVISQWCVPALCQNCAVNKTTAENALSAPTPKDQENTSE